MSKYNGLPYYKRYPRDFIEGTIGMPFELKATYSVVLDLIYMQGGELPDDARYISGLLGVSVRKWNSLRQGLLDAGKLQVSGKFLTNYRALSELESSRTFQEKQRENRVGSSKNKDLTKTVEKPPSDQPEPEPYYSDTNVSDGDAVDFAKVLFDRGVSYLVKHGVSERQARSLIGKFRKEHSDARIFEAFSDCAKQGAVDPVSWLTRSLNPKPNLINWEEL